MCVTFNFNNISDLWFFNPPALVFVKSIKK